MSSILTNNSAMVALQTLKTINSGLSKTQSEISTGKSINNAQDNAAALSAAALVLAWVLMVGWVTLTAGRSPRVRGFASAVEVFAALIDPRWRA